MPELPEVETVVRGLAPSLEGEVIKTVTLRREDLRFPFPENFAGSLAGRRIIRLFRRAKYILASLDDETVWLTHLGMTGRFTVFNATGKSHNLGEFYFEKAAGSGGDGRHDHVVIDLANGVRIVYTDPRRFGFMDHFSQSAMADHKLLGSLGVEPLGNALNAQYLSDAFAGKKAPLKAALLDQKIIAGLGNIYVCEALFRARLSPRRMAGTLSTRRAVSSRAENLCAAIRACLTEAISAGGSTLRDFQNASGEDGSFQQHFDVYDRAGKPCTRKDCTGVIRRITQSGRSTFYCPKCQK